MNIIVEEIKNGSTEIIKDENINKQHNIYNNYIIGEINIKEEEVNKDIRIINSYEQTKREDIVNVGFIKNIKNMKMKKRLKKIL